MHVALPPELVTKLLNLALCGSSVCIAVAFILPTSYYLEVRAAKYAPLRKGAARVVLVAAVAMALVCTGIQVL